MRFEHYEETQAKKSAQAKAVFASLPPYLQDYSLYLQVRLKGTTALAYAQALQSFFNFIVDTFPGYDGKFPKSVPLKPDGSSLKSLSDITSKDVERYIAWLREGDKKTCRQPNRPATVNQRLSAVANLYQFLNLQRDLSTDPTHYVKPVRNEQREIVFLTASQERRLLDGIISMERRPVYGKNANEMKSVPADDDYKARHRRYVIRDCAIVTLLLATGMRVSELVGIDLSHIAMSDQTIAVRRKGSKEGRVAFNREARDALDIYLGNIPADAFWAYPDAEEKKSIAARHIRELLMEGNEVFVLEDIIDDTAHLIGTEDDDNAKNDIRRIISTYLAEGRNSLLKRGRGAEKALFLSSRGKRLSVRAVESLVKFYVWAYLYDEEGLDPDSVHVHTLRASFATHFLAETRDIAKVASAMGHTGTEVTARYYSAIEKNRLYADMAAYKI